MRFLSRRGLLRLLAGSASLLGLQKSPSRAALRFQDVRPVDNWRKTPDRIWLGENFWANPMEDWRIVNGAAECQSTGGDRNIHLLTQQIVNASGRFTMSVHVGRAATGQYDGGAALRIGIRSDIDDHRSNCFAKGGIVAGLAEGMLILGQHTQALGRELAPSDFLLELEGAPAEGQYQLTLTARSADGAPAGKLTRRFPPEEITGNVAVVNNFRSPVAAREGARYRFYDWVIQGDAFSADPGQMFGPVLWSMYSLNDSRTSDGFVLKISALTGPLGDDDNQSIELQLQRGGQWHSAATARLDTDAWVATFRIPHWDATVARPYRLIYRQRYTDQSEAEFSWGGTIRANPGERPLRMAALTCQNDYAFPYEPVVNNLMNLDPDILYFSGDQIYENHGGYGLIRDPADRAILNYLRKFYQFGWAFRQAMRDRPTLCIPDDHDVFQGNLWGEGGAEMNSPADTSSQGGYREPARMVNVVHRTCVSHHPEPFDPTPCLQDISVYYGEVVYGGVGFAVVADRQWKSGPDRVATWEGRADHVTGRDFDTSTLDQPGLELLGGRQEAFLQQWADDWRGHTMKVLLSQTVFAGVATHHGSYDGYLKADLDSGGWPQSARRRAISILRRSMALHINGDQHLTSLTQYGIDQQRDSNWSFCTPAIAVGYPRWWRPDELEIPHEHRPHHGFPDTGEYRDGFGNLIYVFAVGNPELPTRRNRYQRAHEKGSGFGLVTIDKQARTYHIQAFRFLVDATDGQPSNQFPGWPVTIHQAENRGENVIS